MDSPPPLRILHLEDERNDADLIGRVLARHGLDCRLRVAASRADYFAALGEASYDLVISDTGVGDLQGLDAMSLARERYADVPFIFVSGLGDRPEFVERARLRGADACVPKTALDELLPAIRRVLGERGRRLESARDDRRYVAGMERLVLAVQDLSLARELDQVTRVVRSAARELCGADGATFVLREGGQCHYADEDAIAPLWKGQRFPMEACISGWAMQHGESVVIEDIDLDARIPHDAYRATFVKSLAMVPVRRADPIAAIGVYWATTYRPPERELRLIQALADTTAVALENVRVLAELDARVRDRTAELAEVNRELEAFCAAISHDLRAPLRHIDGFARALEEDCAERLDAQGRDHLARIHAAASRMNQLVDDLLRLSRATQTTLARETVDLGAVAREVAAELARSTGRHRVQVEIAEGLIAHGDPRLLRVLLENLLSNAWKFSAGIADARIEVGSTSPAPGARTFFVADNGVGFDMAHATHLFTIFQRLHTQAQFPGTGVGLATVQRIVHKHGGRIWAEAVPGRGATFFFTLPDDRDPA